MNNSPKRRLCQLLLTQPLRDELDDLSSPVSQAYREAKTQVALKLRTRDIELAEAGSTTAAENVSSYYRQMLRDE